MLARARKEQSPQRTFETPVCSPDGLGILDGRISLHVFERGTVTSVRHWDEILVTYIDHFMYSVGFNLI